MAVCEMCKTEYKKKKTTQRTCSKKCAQNLRNQEAGLGLSEERSCLECGAVWTVRKSNPKKFCNISCSQKWKMKQPGFKEKIYTQEVREKISESHLSLKYRNPEQYKRLCQQRSGRMLGGKNPSKNPITIEKGKQTKRINGTLHIWKGKRGGNGSLTEPQKLLASALAWEMEFPVHTSTTRGTGIATNYKLDIANPILKIGIEVDGKGHLSKKVMLKDAKKETVLSSLGWKVLRFTNQEVMTNLSAVLLEIESVIKAM